MSVLTVLPQEGAHVGHAHGVVPHGACKHLQGTYPYAVGHAFSLSALQLVPLPQQAAVPYH